MKIPACFIIIAMQACDANINIIGGDTLYFENTEKLSITCTNNETAIVQYIKMGSTLTSCVLSSGCTISDLAFTVTASVSSGGRYLLESVNNFTTDLCGTYECADLSNGPTDTVNVSLKDFDINAFITEEKEDELSISTPCVFPAVLDDMEITWYTYYDESLKLMSDADLNAVIRAPTTKPCTNVTCGILQAQSFTFGLGESNHLSDSLVEVKIVHPMFKDKPFIWRSSNTYGVVSAKSAPDDSGFPTWLIVVIVIVACVGVVVVVVVVVGVVVGIRKGCCFCPPFLRKTEKRRVVFSLPLFSSFNKKEKRSIADAMDYKHIHGIGKGRTTVNMQDKFHVIVDGKLHVTRCGKSFGWSSGFVNAFTVSWSLSSEIDLVLPSLRTTARKMIEIYQVPSHSLVSADKDVKLLVMNDDNYNTILRNNLKWMNILNGGGSRVAEEQEESDFKQFEVDGVDNLIIIEVPDEKQWNIKTKHNLIQTITTEKVPEEKQWKIKTKHDLIQTITTEKQGNPASNRSPEVHVNRKSRGNQVGHSDVEHIVPN